MSDPAKVPPAPDMRSFKETTLAQRYFLEKYIAEGNFGAVFLSKQMFLDQPARRVAVKLSKHTGIRLEQARELFADVFVLAKAMDEMRDAVARSRLVHVYDAGLAEAQDHRAFVVMEFVEGTTLGEQIRSRERVPAFKLLNWAREIAQAISGLHRLPKPLVHRDLKPDNVLLGLDNAVRVVDFGLTATLDEHGLVPGVAGTYQYMAPETTQGKSRPASDIYSIGLILYKGLTGRLPFDELVVPFHLSPPEQKRWLYNRKQDFVIEPPFKLNNTVSHELDALVLRCLAFDADQRPRDGQELLSALDELEAEPPWPDAVALKEGRALVARDPEGALAVFDRGLGVPQPHPAVQAELLRESAALLEQQGRFKEAADRLVRLWSLIRDSGTLIPLAKERAALLHRISRLYRRAGNGYQADRFELDRKQQFPRVPVPDEPD
jgi:eukaryotic-like serine/threonine-protein kinase